MPPTQAFRHAHLRRPRQALRPFNVKLVGEEQILRGKFFSVMHLILLWRWTTLFAAIGVVVFSPSARSKKVCTDACLSSERDGSCDDGMQRSSSKWCQPGSDCSDCGPRELPDLPSKTYVVQRGDTLNKIGETNKYYRFNTGTRFEMF